MTGDVTLLSQETLKDPLLHVVLYQPEIPANTGNIARLCGAARLPLHLIHPLGFELDDKHLKRAGLDYWPQVDVREHGGLEQFMEQQKRGPAKVIAFSSKGAQPYTRAPVAEGDYLLFGPETRGLPESARKLFPTFSIPMWGPVRSLNLATAVGIVTYHYLHRIRGF